MIPSEWLQHAPKPNPLVNNNEWDVFLSYRSVNRTWVLSLYDILNELGFKVFIDQRELTAGDLLISRLGNALKKSQAGVLIWSEAAADSVWVQQEYEKLESKATTNPTFRFVPIRLDSTELPDFADNRIFIDFTSYPDGPNGGELLRLLYGIVGKPMSSETVRFANQQNEATIDALADIKAAVRNGDSELILEIASEESLPWKTTPSLGCIAAESLIKLKLYDDAIAILEKLETNFNKSLRPKQLRASALSKTGLKENQKKAQRILAKLYEQGERDPETLGMYGRSWMDRYNESKDINDLEQSRKYYAEAFDKAPDDYYTGINAAAKSVFLGSDKDLELADDFARRTLDIVGTDAWPNDYWKTATVAELLLIKGQYLDAANMYNEAKKMEPRSYGNHESTRNQAVKLLSKLNANQNEKEAILNVFAHLS